MLKSRHRMTQRLPGRATPSRLKYTVDIFERLTVLELVVVGYPHVVDGDIGLQNRTFPNLALDALGLIALRKSTVVFFYDESFIFTVCLVSPLEDHAIRGAPVAIPTLTPIDAP